MLRPVMDRSKLYNSRLIVVDFNPKDTEPEDRDPAATLEVEFYPNAIGPKLRRALGTMVEAQEEANRVLSDAEKGGSKTAVDVANAEAVAEQAEKDFTHGLSQCICGWSLTDGGVPIPFSKDALESEGYEFIFKLSSAIFAALSPNSETENK